MSEENVEIMAELARLFEVGDWNAFGALFAEDGELQPPPGWPEPGPHRGRAAIVREFRRIHESWGTNQVVVGDHTARDDRVVIGFHWIVEGAGSGAPGEMTVYVAARLEDGQVAEYRACWSEPEALEAAGLSE